MSRILRILVVAILLYPALLFGEEKLLTIIHTNDLHSHLLGFSPNIDYTPLRTGDDQTVGGWARIAGGHQIGEGEEDESHPRLGRGGLSHGLAFPYGGSGGSA